MGISWSIRLKALLMLVAFAANFSVFCHCATAQKRQLSRCEKRSHCDKPSNDKPSNDKPCCGKHTKSRPCNSAQAVKFNLAEKQIADHIHVAPLPAVILPIGYAMSEPTKLLVQVTLTPVKHPPPDILTLQQRLLI